MKYLFIFALLVNSCSANGYILRHCPDGKKIIAIKKSKSPNAYMAKTSEWSRLLSKCSILNLEDMIKTYKLTNTKFGDKK